MDEKRLGEIEALTDAATAGPWIPKYVKVVYVRSGEAEHEVRSSVNGMTVASLSYRSLGGEIGEDQADRDLVFIAAARAAVPELIAEVRRLQAVASAVKGGNCEHGEPWSGHCQSCGYPYGR
jgi:hypothetical protein